MKKAFWLLLGAVVALGFALVAVKVSDSMANREGFVFDTTQVADVVRLRVVYQGDTAQLEKREGGWFLTPGGEPANGERVQRALRGLLGIRSRDKVSESSDQARLEEFGIGSAEAKQVDWTLSSGEKSRVLLGKTSGTDFNSTYWKWPDKPGVYSTPGDFTFDLASQAQEWKVDGPAPAFQVK
jgi:hypothetical protein